MFDNDDDNDMRDLAGSYFQASDSMRNYVDCQLCGCLVNDNMRQAHRKKCKPKKADICAREGHTRGRKIPGKCSKVHRDCSVCHKSFHEDDADWSDEEVAPDYAGDDIDEDDDDMELPEIPSSRLHRRGDTDDDSLIRLTAGARYKKRSSIGKMTRRSILKNIEVPKRKRRRGAVTSKKTKRKP